MDPTPQPTVGDKLKAAVKGVVPPAMGGTAGTGIPTDVAAQQEALEREMRQEGRAAGGGGYGAGASTAATAMGAGGATGGMMGGGRAAEGAVLHRETGTVVEDRPVVKEVRQEFVEHRPVAQHIETVTRVVGESAMEGGARLEPTGPARERVLREGRVETASGAGGLGGGASGAGGLGGGAGTGLGAGGDMSEEDRLEAERKGRTTGRGAGGI